MTRIAPLLSFFALSVALSAVAWSAEQEKPRPAKPVAGTVVKATADSITVLPTASPRAKEAPTEVTIAVAKDKTEVGFAEVMASRVTNDGSVVSMYANPVPGELADLKAGLNVEVTVAEGAATRVMIVWPTTGTLTKLASGAITFRPDPAAAGGEAPAEETVNVDKETTKVLFKVVAAERKTAAGQVVRSYQFRAGSLDDLKEGQAIGVCAKGGAAVRIYILPAPAAEK